MSLDCQGHELHQGAGVIRLLRSPLVIRSLSPAPRGPTPRLRHVRLRAIGMVAGGWVAQDPYGRRANDYRVRFHLPFHSVYPYNTSVDSQATVLCEAERSDD
jgi:hypothetical protein